VAYLGNLELAPLLRGMRSGMTPRQLVHAWAPRVPPPRGVEIARWLVSRRLLVPQAGVPVRTERGAA